MIDIRDFPGVLNALNQILNSDREATVRFEGDCISVAEHTRFFRGCFEQGAEGRKPIPNQRMHDRWGEH